MKLFSFVICDDVRQELGNKASLMGVYDNDFIVQSPSATWPLATRLGFYIRLKLDEDEEVGKFEFHVLRNGEHKVKVEGSVRIVDTVKFFSIHFNLNPFIIKEPGVLDFMIKFIDIPNPIEVNLGSITVSQVWAKPAGGSTK